MDNEIERAILKTLVYSDIFDYPLTKEEIWKFLIAENPLKRKEFEKELNYLSGAKLVHLEGGHLYCLSGREVIIDTRLVRQKESQRKIVIAKKIVKKMSRIPTIQFIGISGALSLANSSKEDDIDLFVITSRGRLWLTRLTIIIFLLFMGRYRRRNESKVSDKICLNMLIDDGALSFPKERQNLYTAHEIVQLMPVFERNDMHKNFMSENKWVEKFLPNAFNGIRNHESGIRIKQINPLFIIHYSLFILEYLAKTIQLWFIKKHITTETITDSLLAFHPLDYKEKVLSEYNRRVKHYEI